jgi:hypothetical protein
MEKLKQILANLPGGSAIAAQLDTVVETIKAKAKEGALEAVPKIKAEVKSTVEPYVMASLLMGAGGLLLGFAAYRSNRSGRALSGSVRRTRRYR